LNYLDKKEEAKIKVESIAYNSPEFQQAARLRYDLFFAEHNLPWSVTQDSNQGKYLHAAILHENTVLAYGQLVPKKKGIYQICQMVVKPEYQDRNLGKQILSFLIEQAKKDRAFSLTLNARLTAVGFYQKLGFQTYGNSFPSNTTGVMHIAMSKNLRN